MLNVRSTFFSNSVATSQKTLNIHCKYVLLNAVQGNDHRLYCDDLRGVSKVYNSTLPEQMALELTGFRAVDITTKQILIFNI
jgi:hypothetical protein